MLALLFAVLSLAMMLPADAQSRRDQPLIETAAKGDLVAVERLIARGVSIDARDGRGRTCAARRHPWQPRGGWHVR
jgi:hypothetical protein